MELVKYVSKLVLQEENMSFGTWGGGGGGAGVNAHQKVPPQTSV